ncbi:MAG: DUF433 domain-containing protein [Hymenobacter sp.]|nr:MAG: DUF433 domain-containing protein [Hymenobacter sp.]
MLCTDLVTIDPEITGGTRVPIQALFDYLGGDEPLTMFLYDFPSVSREQAAGVLKAAQAALLPPAFHVAPAQSALVPVVATVAALPGATGTGQSVAAGAVIEQRVAAVLVVNFLRDSFPKS